MEIPQELLNKSIRFLPQDHEDKSFLSDHTAVLRAWQEAVELITLRSLRVVSEDLDIFK